jgi:hypothetical protein
VAEPPAAAGPGTAATERDVLLATKLNVPGPQPGFVPRPRLAEALGEGLARGLILVCAPAGSGKTALLADWAGTVGPRPRGCRWMPVITTRPGSGAMRSPRWTMCAWGSANGLARCSARLPRCRSRGW